MHPDVCPYKKVVRSCNRTNHLLVETPQPNLSLGMRQLNGRYTQAYNRRHQRGGHLFQGRFTAIIGWRRLPII
jgi:hypothetical protein